MSKFIQLKDEHGKAFLVNAAFISKVWLEGEHTVIAYSANANSYSKSEWVRNSFQDVKFMLGVEVP